MSTTGPATIRSIMTRQLWLPANVGAQIGIVSDQMTKLRAGDPVELTRAQLTMFGDHPSKPANLDDHERWLLVGDNTLAPA